MNWRIKPSSDFLNQFSECFISSVHFTFKDKLFTGQFIAQIRKNFTFNFLTHSHFTDDQMTLIAHDLKCFQETAKCKQMLTVHVEIIYSISLHVNM